MPDCAEGLFKEKICPWGGQQGGGPPVPAPYTRSVWGKQGWGSPLAAPGHSLTG